MASDGKEKGRKLFKPNIPHFFKIIFQESIDKGRIEIPGTFVIKYGNDLPNQISLMVPTDKVWKVGLVKSNGRVYIENGWREFQQYYSIAHGTFLSFEYRSRSFFHVIVYDLSTTEIDYPYNDDDDDGDDDEDDDDCLPSSSKKRKRSPLPCPLPPKVERSGGSSGSESKFKLHTLTSDGGGNKVSRTLKNLGRNPISLNKSRGFKEAAGFKLENPSVSVIMKPAYINGNYVNIHINFATKYLKQDKCDVILQNSEKRTWTVGYVIYNERRLARLASGWSVFVRDNNLVAGTKCIFELIDRVKLLLNVHIVRATIRSIKFEKLTDMAHPCIPELQSEDSCKDRGKQQLSGNKRKLSNKNVRKKLTGGEKIDALSRSIAAFHPANPFFRAIMQPTYIRIRMDVPFLFAKRHFKKNNCAVVLQNVGGRTWNVYCRINSKNRQAYFKGNWAAFVQDNNLEIGDVCTFELTKSAELVLKFVIVRASDSHPSVGSMQGSKADAGERNVFVDSKIEFGLTPNSNKVEVKCEPDGKSAGKQHREKSDRQLSERLSSSWIHKVVEAAENFHSIHPFFKATMKFHNLQRSVFVPAKFVKISKLGADNASTFQLQVGEKRWPVKFCHSPKRKIWELTSGWAEFSGENLLKVGEICAFELVDRESLQVKVSIFRHDA